jgi:hypothetical protein
VFGIFKSEKRRLSKLRQDFEDISFRATRNMNTLEFHTFSGGLQDFPIDQELPFISPTQLSSSEWKNISVELHDEAMRVFQDGERIAGINGEAHRALADVLAYFSIKAETCSIRSSEALALRIAMDAFEKVTHNYHEKLLSSLSNEQ